MKNSINTTVLLKAYDLQLKAILESDLKKFKADKQRQNNEAFLQRLKAA